MTVISFTFPLPLGLHARPASMLQEACLPLAAAVGFRNERNRRRADARSVLALVASGTTGGDLCRLEISGPGEQAAAQALRYFLRRVLPHADDHLPPPLPAGGAEPWLPPVFPDGAAGILPGRALAPGIGRGPALAWQRAGALPRRFAAGTRDAQKELALFKESCRELESELRAKAAALRDANAAGIMRAHLGMLGDPGFQERIRNGIIRERKPAGAAIGQAAAHFARLLQGSPSAYLRERAEDVQDLARQLGEKLYGRAAARPGQVLRRSGVVAAAALAPSELLRLDRRRLRGLVLAGVGPTSHTVILARSFGIPAVAVPAAELGKIKNGAELVVDGRRGLVCLEPGPALKRYYRLEQRKLDLARRQLDRLKNEPAQSGDGKKLAVAANIGSAAELGPAWKNGAEGIGLYRTEALFLERAAPPGEAEQFAAYREAARTARGRAVIVRTLDIGGDKRLPYLPLPPEENPFLGYRAVRFYAGQPELIQCQLRAILRAARCGSLKVMVPMVTGVEEVRLVRRMLAAAAGQLQAENVPHAGRVEVGIMVETPAAALFLDRLGREADFFSIGSNDLLQYFLAADRGNARLADLYDPRHPAFLRLLFQVSRQARKAGRWLGLCGEMAGDAALLPLLLGLGLDELSMASGRIPAVKARLRQLRSAECGKLLQAAMNCADAAEVSELLRDFNSRSLGAGVTAPELIRLDADCRSAAEAIKELCDLLELAGRAGDAAALEQVVWQREQTYATDLGFGFAIPHGKADTVKAASIAFLRPRRPFPWAGNTAAPVRGVLLIAVPAAANGQEHLQLIARLSRRLMHEDFRAELLSAADAATALAVLRQCLPGS